ncbi:hypothetical protein HMPREF3159_01355 [Brachybacterium sp. HMSC06H03]|uniref:NACHT domain-containing protein n=1 Tax=Brachybacterium sp. HMSC06H03 TaxID=1581127 RepID=UPI0008A39654|nr:hypothetical protein [Brachybacterium sp. HMSC06H03]OFT65039.1 hypothetical protein HMPREF3159_01355 [Brachybacterium sp. HMSC06H03]
MTGTGRRLAETLGAAAIAAASGVPLDVTTFAAAVPYIGEALDARSSTKRLRRAVTEDLTNWAESEGLSEYLEQGIEIAMFAIARHGLQVHVLRRCSFDVERISESIINEVRGHDHGWGCAQGSELDGVHVVARGAVHAVVTTLVRQEHRVEGEILPVLADALKAQAERYERAAERDEEVLRLLRNLAAARTREADAEDLQRYLEQRLQVWDLETGIMPLHGRVRHPSQIERALNVASAEEGDGVLSVGQALARYEHLVVLGGPGAGKSWLAHRIVRDAAHAARDALRNGSRPQDVEIPILTTWETVRSQPANGSIRSRLLAASFASPGNGDLGSVELEERLQRLLGESRRVLVVVDSLDEAEKGDGADLLLRDIEGIADWRTVVTSRPSAWGTKPLTRRRTKGLATLRPLTWDTDTIPFIRTWFAGDPERAEALIGHLEADSGLRDSAGIPLMLGFFCVHAEEAPLDSPLPRTGHELYDTVIESLLVGDWSSATRPGDDQIAEAKRVLADWAWDAVRDAEDRAGLGDWGEAFTPATPGVPSPELLRALDNVAPLRRDGGGRTARTFRHRTVLEHLVATRIACLDAAATVDVLLPHLWYDPDWEVAVPRALALHPERNEVARRLHEETRFSTKTPLIRESDEQLGAMWLEVAADSCPEDWSEPERRRLEGLRVARCLRDTARVLRSGHWPNLDGSIVTALLSSLPTAEPRRLAEHCRAIARWATTGNERDEAVQCLMQRISSGRAAETARVVDALMQLGPSPKERRDASERILSVFAGEALPRDAGALAGVLLRLGLAVEDRRAARERILYGPRDEGTVGLTNLSLCVTGKERKRLLDALHALDLTCDERREAVRSLRAACDRTNDPTKLYRQVDALLSLDPQPEERRGLPDVIRAALPDAEPSTAALLVGALVRLDPEVPVPEDVSARIVDLLSGAKPKRVVGLVGALVTLDASEARRRAAAQTVLERLATSPSRFGGLLIEALLRLEPTAEERRTAASQLLDASNGASPKSVGKLLSALVRIGATPEDREQARGLIVSAIPRTSDVELVDHLVVTFERLEPTDEDRRGAVAALQRLLIDALPGRAANLAATLRRLNPTEDERRRAAATMQKALTQGTVGDLARVAEALLDLEITADERAAIAQQLLLRIEETNGSWGAKRPARVLRQLTTVSQWTAMLHGADAVT